MRWLALRYVPVFGIADNYNRQVAHSIRLDMPQLSRNVQVAEVGKE